MQSSFLNFDQFLRYRSISYKFGSQDLIYPEKWNKYKSYKKNILFNSNLQILIFLIYLKKGFQVCTTLVLFWFFFALSLLNVMLGL